MVKSVFISMTLYLLIHLFISGYHADDSQDICDKESCQDVNLSVNTDDRVTSPDTDEFCDDDYIPSVDSDRVVDFPEFKHLLDKENVHVIDVREPEELVEDGIIPGAINIPLGEVETVFSLAPTEFKDKYHFDISHPESVNVIFSCRSGCRSEEALETVLKLGFKKARHFGGGFLEWDEKIANES